MTRSVWLIGLMAAGVCAAPLATAAATVTCKATVASSLMASDDDADSSWRTVVTNQYGADWADLGKAKDKHYYDLNLALATLHYLDAKPCRNALLINKLPGNLNVQSKP